jgi:ubiquinone/menaquinone biosynthesis C-methylase UbiE
VLPQATLVGVDNELKTLQLAKHSLALYQDRLILCQDDLLAYLQKQPDSTFDVFVSVWVIHNLAPDYREKLFSEIRRTLKPGGLFINGDKYAQDNPQSHAEDLQQQLRLFDVFESIGRPELKTEWTQHYLEDDRIKMAESTQKSILQNLGFEDIKISYRQGMEAIFTAIT